VVLTTLLYKKKTLLIFLQSYTLLLMIGGIFAHASHSIAAMIASIFSGMLIQVGSWLVWREKKWALHFNLISVLGLTMFFIYRWLLTQKFYPPAFLVLISLSLVFKICQALSTHKNSKKIAM